MTRRMNPTNIIFLAVVIAGTFGIMELLKANFGAPVAYAVGASLVAALLFSFLRK